MRRAVVLIACVAGASFAADKSSLMVMISLEVPLGSRVDATVKTADGGTIWKKTTRTTAASGGLVAWVPNGSYELTVSHTFLDGGVCTAVRPFLVATIDDPIFFDYWIGSAGDRCFVAPLRPVDERTGERLDMGDFPDLEQVPLRRDSDRKSR